DGAGASMGPRLGGRGWLVAASTLPRSQNWLQWSRARVGADGEALRDRGDLSWMLQWSRARVGADGDFIGRDRAGDRLLQWSSARVGADGCSLIASAARPHALQWSRARVGADGRRLAAYGPAHLASMEPRPGTRRPHPLDPD